VCSLAPSLVEFSCLLTKGNDMGADITHGAELRKTSTDVDGDIAVEIMPVAGGYYGASYSTVKAAVEYAESIGVDPEFWPIYYGIPDSEIEIADVYDRSTRLQRCLSGMPVDVLSRNALLKRVADWLQAGERLLITE
jgi:hypothetical protein